ncbi:MAG TPA: hypothetical protein VKA84_09950 [Gemmatimonadaceae bacterium]|nr:hypothetical protein [Gemmatimonadaceae bacterium]
MFDLKPITREGVPAALQKAEHYRLINDPSAAESICLDILGVDPENQQALIALLLSITDQFGGEIGAAQGAQRARELAARIRDEYRRTYYTGIIWERAAKAHMRQGRPGSGTTAYQWFREAMEWYERAERMRPPGNDEAILRWNTCARVLTENPHLTPPREEAYEPSFE